MAAPTPPERPATVTTLPTRGLSTGDVLRRQHADGPNALPRPPQPSPWRMLARQLTHLLAVLLWVGSGLALVGGMPELAVAIAVIVVLNAVFAFAQEYRADRSTARLRDLLPAYTRVVRDGRETTVPVADLVVGDVVLLTAGDRVGADMRVDTAHALALDESMVTGESGAVSRLAGASLMTGTFVLTGEGQATVTATGARTRLSEITELTASAHRPPSPLTRQLEHVVRTIAVIAAVTGTGLGVAAVLLGLSATKAFLFGVGVAVALVPEGLLPTVTLSLARGARLMARRDALVRRLDAVETLGATTFICTDKTGTLTQNRMAVREVVTPVGLVRLEGHAYDPVASIAGPEEAVRLAGVAAAHALSCVTGRVVQRQVWVAEGDPMEAAVHCLALRLGVGHPQVRPARRPYTPDRMLTSSLAAGEVAVLGAPEAVFAHCDGVPPAIGHALEELADKGRRVLAVARRPWSGEPSPQMEEHLEILGLLALHDPPRPEVAESLRRCALAGIRVAMLTGDHPRTARAIAREVGLLGSAGHILDGRSLPADDEELAARLDSPDGAVVARVSPEGKLRIARALRSRGHVVAMTGDGVNDAPALREADVGVAMGATGSDVARESADLVLLDDRFATIVTAIELGRATFANVRRFLTYHLTDNVAELAPFAVWAVTGSTFPLAISVLQVLALDIGTDMLPALALGAEPPRPNIMHGRRRRTLIDRHLLLRAFAALGLTEAVTALAAFTVILVAGGWSWGTVPESTLLADASGTAFATIAVGQMVNAFACRSTTMPLWRLRPQDNPFVVLAVAAELTLLAAFLGLPSLADLLGGSWPSATGWALAAGGGVAVATVDAVTKVLRRREPPRTPALPPRPQPAAPGTQRTPRARRGRADRGRAAAPRRAAPTRPARA